MALKYVGPLAHWKTRPKIPWFCWWGSFMCWTLWMCEPKSGLQTSQYLMFEKSNLGTGFTENIGPYSHEKSNSRGSIRCKSIISQLGLTIPSVGKTSSGRTLGIPHVFRFPFVPEPVAFRHLVKHLETLESQLFQTPDTAVALSWHLGRLGLQRQGGRWTFSQDINGGRPWPCYWLVYNPFLLDIWVQDQILIISLYYVVSLLRYNWGILVLGTTIRGINICLYCISLFNN